MSDAERARKFTQPIRTSVQQPYARYGVGSSHEEALDSFGEFGIFTLMWRQPDFDKGLVDRCPPCWNGVHSQQAKAFRQPQERECPACFGTTFEGGYRAQIIRPLLVSDRADVISEEERGVMTTDTLQFETTSDFTLTLGDYLFRFDNTRYQCEQNTELVMRTGFGSPFAAESLQGLATAHLEAPTSVAYKIPPADTSMLTTAGGFNMADLDSLNVLVRPGGYI